jgi:hypothetical protein
MATGPAGTARHADELWAAGGHHRRDNLASDWRRYRAALKDYVSAQTGGPAEACQRPEDVKMAGTGLRGAMINILSAVLSGATLINDPMHAKKPQSMDVGHCFIADRSGLPAPWPPDL